MAYDAHSNVQDEYDPAVIKMRDEMADLISKAGFKYVMGHGSPVAAALRPKWTNVAGAQEVGDAFGISKHDAILAGKR